MSNTVFSLFLFAARGRIVAGAATEASDCGCIRFDISASANAMISTPSFVFRFESITASLPSSSLTWRNASRDVDAT